jgi:uncharacterized membrane protein YbhN (UPF0104 family)
MATWPLAVIAPARASDVLRALVIRDCAPVWAGAGSVVAEKLVDVQMLCALSLLGALWCGHPEWATVAGGLMVAEWTGVLLLLRFRSTLLNLSATRSLRDKLQDGLSALEALADDKQALWRVSTLSLAAWLSAALLAASLLALFSARVPFPVVLAGWPLATLAGLVPFTLAGMGTRDAAFLGFVTTVGSSSADPSAILAATVGFSLVGTWTPALFAFPWAVAVWSRGLPQPCTRTPVSPSRGRGAIVS